MGRKSLADSQNYGNDPTARDLINPPAFAELNLPEDSTTRQRSKENLLEVFARIGYTLDRVVADCIFNEASGGSRSASITEFRIALNGYLDALEAGDIEDWRRARGV